MTALRGSSSPFVAGSDETIPEAGRVPDAQSLAVNARPRVIVRGTFKATPRSVARENLSVLTSRGSKRTRRIHLTNGPNGYGLPVLLIPGFMTGDWSMSTMAKVLKAWQFAPARSGMFLNMDCTETLLTRLEERLEIVAKRSNRQVAIVGWSRGGTLGRLLALRRPDLTAGLITLASPHVNPLAINTSVARQINALVRLSNKGLRGVLTDDCIHGDCAYSMAEGLAAEFPGEVPYISIYTKRDGVVDWRSCLDPYARNIEVRSTHLGIGSDPRVYRLIGNSLASFARLRMQVPAVSDRIPLQRPLPA